MPRGNAPPIADVIERTDAPTIPDVTDRIDAAPIPDAVCVRAHHLKLTPFP